MDFGGIGTGTGTSKIKNITTGGYPLYVALYLLCILQNKNSFTLSNLYRVERGHYYDNCYHMNYIPKQYAGYLVNLIKK